MKETEAEEFLEINKVEKAIRPAADTGSVVFAIVIEAKQLDLEIPYRGPHGVIVFSTSRLRNLQMLTEIGDEWVPLGVV